MADCDGSDAACFSMSSSDSSFHHSKVTLFENIAETHRRSSCTQNLSTGESPIDHCDVVRVRQHLQNVLDEFCELERGGDGGVIRG